MHHHGRAEVTNPDSINFEQERHSRPRRLKPGGCHVARATVNDAAREDQLWWSQLLCHLDDVAKARAGCGRWRRWNDEGNNDTHQNSSEAL